MDKKFTEEEFKKLFEEAQAKTDSGTAELSADELDGVSGGWNYKDNGSTITLYFTDQEYNQLKQYLDTDIAKGIMALNGLNNFKFAKTMTLPAGPGKTVVNLLNLMYH